jgi:hypothetical protein
MGVFADRILAVFLLVPRRARNASDDVRVYGAPDERPASPVWVTDRNHSPSTSVQRADFEALRAISRVR